MSITAVVVRGEAHREAGELTLQVVAGGHDVGGVFPNAGFHNVWVKPLLCDERVMWREAAIVHR
jgi:hypothetical protein